MSRSGPEAAEVAAEISAFEPRWKEAASQKAVARLLRLVLLRELYGRLHACKSAFLARQAFEGVARADDAEHKIQAWAFGDLAELPETLADLTRAAPSGTSGTATWAERLAGLPSDLIDALGRERLERGASLAQQGSLTDRPWELLLVCEARRSGCEFWSLQASCPIAEAEHLQLSVAGALWPQGALLSTRTLGIHSDTRTWEGQWQVALDSGPGSAGIRKRIPGRWSPLPEAPRA